MLQQILIGLLIMVGGLLMVLKTQWFLNMIGRVDFAERMFGGGGTRLFYKLLGSAIAILGIIVATDLFDRLIGEFIINLFAI